MWSSSSMLPPRRPLPALPLRERFAAKQAIPYGALDPGLAPRSKKLSRNVEAHEPIVIARRALGDLPQGGAECVRKVELKQMAAYAFLDAESREWLSRSESGNARRYFRHQIHG